jgi:predicted cupin superfamily sugar epimerase
MTAAGQIIEFFGMKPLPDEGGYYVETYRASEKIGPPALPPTYHGERNLATAILYLITADSFSALHKLRSDEVFHFYLGDPVTMLQLHPDRTSEIITLGHDVLNEQRIQVTVPAGAWQGCFLNKPGRFALMGTTVTPGFESADFEAGQRIELLKKYPNRRDLILKLTAQE